MIAAEQIRAGRALLRWKAQELADRTGLTLRTIQRLESEVGIPASRSKNLMTIRKAFEEAGVIFIDQSEERGPGVQLRDPI